MFHRRRASSNPPVNSTPSPAAALAASQAFIKNRNSNASLSSAAAAAALRTHATSPTPVGDIQTKRMVRRGSASSMGSGDSQQGLGLRRQSSSGSMSERTFRTSSPNRSSPVVEADPNAPPVPAIPKEVPNPSVYRRASSLEPPFRGASPAARRGGGRGVSVDRTTVGPAGRGHITRVTNLSQVPEVDRENSTRSINFSRPISPQASSPVGPPRTSHSGWFTTPVVGDQPFRDQPATRPKTSDGLPANESLSVQQSVQNAADKPVSKRKVKMAQGAEGSRLASGSMGQRPTGSAVIAGHPFSISTQPVDPNSPSSVYDPSTRTFRKKEELQNLQEAVYVAKTQPQRHQQVVQSQQSAVERPRSTPHNFQTRAGPLLARESSEDYGEEDQETSTPEVKTGTGLDPSQADRPNDPSVTSVSTATPPLLPALGIQHAQSATKPATQSPTNPTQGGNGRGSERGQRPQSLSPGRSAHFAAVAVELPNGVRHQPPPRSISPAKSALKHSPSSSVRTSSPIANFIPGGGRGAPSEASDTVSEDGSKPAPRKKKNVRVSFDEDAVIAGPSASLESPVTSPSKSVETSRWNGLQPGSADDDMDEIMTPRPTLPSFGSIRGRSRRDDEDMAEKVTETVSPSMSASVSTMSEPLETSSDHALASIVAQDFVSKQNLHATANKQESGSSKSNLEPLPPEVTSVEGSGYVSDSDQSVNAQDEKLVTSNDDKHEHQTEIGLVSQAVESEIEHGNAEATEQPNLAVPSIAVLPATPAAGEDSKHVFIMPGGFPDQHEEPKPENEVMRKDQSKNDASNNPNSEPTTMVVSEPSIQNPPPSHAFQEQQQPQQTDYRAHLSVVQEDSDESDDGSSIYSDAAEDLSDMEDGAFASIDAVLESPMVSPVPGLAVSTPSDSPLTTLPPNQGTSSNIHPEQSRGLPLSNSDGDWNWTKQFWSELSETRKQEIEREAKEEPTGAASTKAAVPTLQAPKPRKKKSLTAGQSQGVSASRFAQPIEPAMQQRTAQPRNSAMKKSMRPTSEPTTSEIQMRKTMRSNDGPRNVPESLSSETHLRKSMRDNGAIRTSKKGSGLVASRYSVPLAESHEPRGALQKRNIPQTSSSPLKARPQTTSGPLITQTKPTQLPSSNRKFSNDSDSDASVSSFRRQKRKPTMGDGSRYTMRRSMREGSEPAVPGPTMRPHSVAVTSPPPSTLRTSMRPTSPSSTQGGLRSSRFSVRSLSPSGGMMGKPGRNTLIGAGVPTLRSQGPPPPKPTTKIPGFGKSTKPKTITPTKAAPRFKSRFADSSDEEEDLPRRFQSRFADSDDEDFELPSGLTPVRGIPRKPGEEDRESTDLSDEDSDDEATGPGPSTKDFEKSAGPQLTNGKAPGAFIAGSLRKSKYADDQPKPKSPKKEKSRRRFFGLGKKKPLSVEPVEAPTAEPVDVSQQGRPLTPIGEDKTFDTVSPASPTGSPRPHNSRLQRRLSPQWGRSTSDSWPLPQPPNVAQDARPQSSDGAMATEKASRPGLSKRYSSATAPPNVGFDPKTGKEVVFGRTGKKKKFPMLRKVFGLND